MPDPLVDAPEREVSERPLPPRDRPPVDFTQAPHAYIESEFSQGKGHCDMCGGGPDAEIHQPPPPEPLARIADALERIAAFFDTFPDTAAKSAEGLAKLVKAMAPSDPFQTFLRDVFVPKFGMYFRADSTKEGGEMFADWMYAGFPEHWHKTVDILHDPATIEASPLKDAPGFTDFVEGYLSFDPEEE